MITCVQRVRIYGQELKLCLMKLLVDKFSSKLGLQQGMCRFLFYVSGGVKKVSSWTGD
jgi:hypothetical protein